MLLVAEVFLTSYLNEVVSILTEIEILWYSVSKGQFGELCSGTMSSQHKPRLAQNVRGSGNESLYLLLHPCHDL